MSDHDSNDHNVTNAQPTIADLLRGVEPMGDLSELAIDDLTPAEEDEFFAILEQI